MHIKKVEITLDRDIAPKNRKNNKKEVISYQERSKIFFYTKNKIKEKKLNEIKLLKKLFRYSLFSLYSKNSSYDDKRSKHPFAFNSITRVAIVCTN